MLKAWHDKAKDTPTWIMVDFFTTAVAVGFAMAFFLKDC